MAYNHHPDHPHLFGPVNSRRLGRSLGVDMVPFKTCNCNCVYCECGAAHVVGNVRREYVAAKELTGELADYLDSNANVDYITFAGSGEPTLNSALGTVIRFVKERYPAFKTALITNGTLLYLPEVRAEILSCDLVMPSLDAVSQSVFNRINRPHPDCNPDEIIEGLHEFSHEYGGELWVEVFIVPGVNDTDEELGLLRQTLLSMKLTRVQLNSLDRRGACEWVKAADPQNLDRIARFMEPLPVEIIART